MSIFFLFPSSSSSFSPSFCLLPLLDLLLALSCPSSEWDFVRFSHSICPLALPLALLQARDLADDSSDGDIEETTLEMGFGIGREPRKQLQREGMGLLMRRLIISVPTRRRGMFGCGRSLSSMPSRESAKD